MQTNKVESNVENMDCMDIESLRAFVSKPLMEHARSLFPDRPAKYVTATRELHNYGWNKITAMEERGKGRILTAQKYEKICERIYASLPGYAKW